MSHRDREVDVSIIIKALNEEQKIAGSIESALAALQGTSGEVILADSLSTDKTIDIASAYDITIVQLADASERSCGIGPQLGFQYCAGRFIYILDGDMQIDAQFIPQAISFLEANPDVAGVAGLVREMNTENYIFRLRTEKQQQFGAGYTDHLGMGGLYRRSALDEAGYMSNRNLHSFEELELGLRLGSLGWRLARLPVPAVSHTGHDEGVFPLLARRWRSKYLSGSGELIKAATGKPHLFGVLKSQKYLLATLFVWSIIAAGLLCLHFTVYILYCGLILLLVMFILLVLKKRDLRSALTSLLWWHAGALGLLRGLLARQKDARARIESNIIKQARLHNE